MAGESEIPLSSLPDADQARLQELAGRVLAYFDEKEAEDGGAAGMMEADRAALYAGSAYSRLSDAKFGELLALYGLGFESARELAGGLSNSNFMVRTGGHDPERVVVKLCDEKNEAELRVQLAAVEALRRAGFPTAYPLRTLDGETLVLFEGGAHRVIVFEAVPGGVPASPAGEDVMRQLGDAMARLHLVEEVPACLGEFPMGVVQMRPFLDEEVRRSDKAAHPFVAYLERGLAQVLPAVRREGLARRIVHGDVFLENTMFEDGELRAIIDFEEVCAAPAVLDVAMTVVGCCFSPGGAPDYAAVRAFLRAYHARRPLPAAERAAFCDFVRYSLLSIAFWRFRQFNVRRPDEARASSHEQMTRRIDAMDDARWEALLAELD